MTQKLLQHTAHLQVCGLNTHTPVEVHPEGVEVGDEDVDAQVKLAPADQVG